jgi:protein-S-isoprenylcysteine O-methyltransferase Ste14
VRERAKTMQARRSKVRSLWVPMLVCSALVIILCTAIWAILSEYELLPNSMPDTSLILLLWFLPLSAALLGMVWFRRSRGQRDHAEEEQA